MPDYGHDLLFGCFLTPAAERAETTLRLAVRAEQLGLDLVSAQDHPYQPAFLDTWTLLSVIAARTSRVRVFPNVANLPLRPPAMLARAVASLDILSGGRAELGLGAGAFWDAIAAMDGPRRSPADAVAALREAIAVIRALWTPGLGVRLTGDHYRLAGARPGPFPVHPVGIWLGAYKQRMLELTGAVADGWLPSSPYAPPEQLTRMNEIIDEAAASAGRPPGAIRRLYNVAGSFNTQDGDFLQGPPKVWAEQLAELALTEGISGFILTGDALEDLELFAQEVTPAVRELVQRERDRADPATPGQHETATPRASTTATRAAGYATAPQAADPDLGVEPTPDSGHRISPDTVWDESARPAGPSREATARYADEGRAFARDLIRVHDHLRGELTQLRDMIVQVAAGRLEPGAARSAINALTVKQNEWTLGAYCQSYCRFVGMHHTLEDTAMFPGLRRADSRLAPVVARLSSEHEAIAGILIRIDRALVSMVRDPAAIGEVQAAVDLLTDALMSHLSYEERELVEPLARLGPRIFRWLS
jgi:alkanesulfonate monooxygenase SsuD/methylene tetrahydromethanopterin reductase-like flavin-dependent oxidoreductase (luciferase family)